MRKLFTNESELLQGVIEKDPQALDHFLVPLHAKATYFAYRIVKDNHFAIESVNDAHLAFIKTAPAFDSLRDAEIYFYTSTRNKALNYQNSRRRKRWSNLLCKFPEIRDGTDPLTTYTQKEIYKRIQATLEKFPAVQQTILKRTIDGYKTEEIAIEIGKNKQYVLNTKIKTFKKLRAILNKLLLLL